MDDPNTFDDRPEFAQSPVTTPPSHPVHRTHQIVHLLNARRYSDPFFNNLFTPSAHIEKHGIVMMPPTAETFIAEYKAKATANPNIHAQITNSSAVVDEHSGLAQVVLYCAITGYSEGEVGKRAITLMCSWRKDRRPQESGRRDECRWKCNSYYMFYGIQEF